MVENDVKCGLHFHWCEIKATSCHNLLFTVIIQSCAAKQGMKIWLWEIPEKKKKTTELYQFCHHQAAGFIKQLVNITDSTSDILL